MNRALAILLVLSLAPVPAAAAGRPSPPRGPAAQVRPSPGAPARMSPAEAETLKAAILRDRQQALQWLKSGATSQLATIQRLDFGARRTLTVGRAADNDVRLDDPAVQPHHLRVAVVGDSFEAAAVDPAARFRLNGADRREARLGPGALGVGRYTLRLSHQHYPAIIVFDPRSPHFKAYKGLHWFPVDFAYRYVLPLTPEAHPDTVTILSTRGSQRRAVRVGWFDFQVGGRACRLEAERLLEPGVGENDVGVYFTDATSGRESYPMGRYVDVARGRDGRYVLDFNTAYNPACAVSEHYNCPIPPKANHLQVAIRAGEMDSHYH
ncbi:MAG TPA: DUF1684 domain-containing protein [Candidatus Saccharimonadales bacterium]|nr:DUF1684 domain-containing protein [Candidatus Saccharimonadales bacterium]